MEDKIFLEEQDHLLDTYNRILGVRRGLEEFLKGLRADASD